MSDPTTNSGAAGAAGFAMFKAIGGVAGMAAIGAVLATVVAMLMTPPRSPSEWAVGLISTVIGSICGGAALISYFSLQAWMHAPEGLVAVLGMVFACGLPAWAIVRAAFTWLQKRQGKDLGELVREARQDFGGPA